MNRKIKQALVLYLIIFFILCIVILYHRGKEKHPFTTKNLDAKEYNVSIPVTAILLHWKRTKNVKTIVSDLVNRQFITEIIIWNNNPDVQLSHEDFHNIKKTSLRIINSPNNLHDLAKHISCSMASNTHCYFIDDDWNNKYIESIYANMVRFPQLIHSYTMPIIHYEQKRWSVFDEEIDLHAGFTWLGCGSFLPKEKSIRFLKQLSTVNLSKNELLIADMYFSIWNNEFPMQLENDVHALPDIPGAAWHLAQEDEWGTVYANIYKAAKILHKYLKDPNQNLFNRKLGLPIEKMDVRAPCHNDRCLFITDLSSFPSPKVVKFDPKVSIKDQEKIFDKIPDFPPQTFWLKHAYHLAVDGDVTSCWKSTKNIKTGNYFGLDLLKNNRYEEIQLILNTGRTDKTNAALLLKSLKPFISTDGKTWVEPRFSIDAWTLHEISKITITDGSEFRFIKLISTKDFKFPFTVCEIIVK